jgi:hypothetical protein
MPVDLGALPDRVKVPDEQRALVPWLIALVLILAAGAAASILTWPDGRSTQTPWFWMRAFGLPALLWLSVYSAWRFVNAHRRRNALEDNAAIDRKEQRLHDDASVPFTVIGQSWRLSSWDDKQRAEDAMKNRESTDWVGFVIPDRPFFPGNHADEVLRHAALLEWLLVEMVSPLAHEIKDGRKTAIWLRLDSLLPTDDTRAVISRAWATLGLLHPEKVQLLEMMSLYAIDGWLDECRRQPRHLAIAVQLRGAISGGLQTGQAEAAAALLLQRMSADSADSESVVFAHRPAKASIESFDEGVANALRWGNGDSDPISAVWNAGLSEPLAKAFKSMKLPMNNAATVELTRTVGDAGIAASWLALALAAERAGAGAGAQLIMDQQDGDLVATVCRKKI